MYNDYMYAIDRSDEYLEHYGIKGMKWGVRKAILSGNSKRLDRQYRKASKKLAKLKARANNGEKYARRASALRLATGVAGGLALAGTGRVGRGIEAIGTLARSTRNKHLRTAGQVVAGAGDALNRFGASNSIAKGIANSKAAKDITEKVTRSQIAKLEAAANRGFAGMAPSARASKNAIRHVTEDQARKIYETNQNKLKNIQKTANGISNNAIIRAGLGAAALGTGAAAAYNQYRATHTSNAAKKAAKFESEMNKAFAGTKYGKSSGSRKRRHRS